MNIVDTCKLLPAITKGHLDYFGCFEKLDRITDIQKPSDDVWEFHITMTQDHLRAVIFLTEDARTVGCCYQEIIPATREERASRNYIRKVKYIAVRVIDFNQWLGFPKQREEVEDKHGFYHVGDRRYGILAELREWAIEAVANRVHGRTGCDTYGRVWPDGTVQCPICGQPTFDEEDCDHTKLPDSRISELRNYGNKYDKKVAT